MARDAKLRAAYETLKDRASEALRLGDLKGALAGFDRAYSLARRIGERSLEDTALCNRSAVAIRLELADTSVPELRQMLLRTADPNIAYLSAYNLARASDGRKDFRKALFYARIAHRYAVDVGDRDKEASALNWIGNALVALNDFAGALREYRQANCLIDDEESERRALLLANLGYCLLLTGEEAGGFRTVIRSLRMARRLSAPVAESVSHLCLSFAYLLVGRPRYAADHGITSLELAERHGDHRTVKHALLLLGEAYKQSGNHQAALECFELLQATYYPGMGQVPQMLLQVDVCRMVNLRG